MARTFAELQQRLGPALSANRLGSETDHVMIPLPSYSVSESLLSHYGDRIPSLEHRYLNALLIARFGLTAIGRTADEARELEDGVRDIVDRLCRSPRMAGRSGSG